MGQRNKTEKRNLKFLLITLFCALPQTALFFWLRIFAIFAPEDFQTQILKYYLTTVNRYIVCLSIYCYIEFFIIYLLC